MTNDDTRVLNRVGTAEDGTGAEHQEMGAIPKVPPTSHTVWQWHFKYQYNQEQLPRATKVKHCEILPPQRGSEVLHQDPYWV